MVSIATFCVCDVFLNNMCTTWIFILYEACLFQSQYLMVFHCVSMLHFICYNFGVCTCVYAQGHLCKWVYSYVSAWRDTVIMSGIICQVLFTCFTVVCDGFFHLPELGHVGEVWWLVSFRHQPVSALPNSALRIQECFFILCVSAGD